MRNNFEIALFALFLSVLSIPVPALARSKKPVYVYDPPSYISVNTQMTYATYISSNYRESLNSDTISVGYYPYYNLGLGLSVKRSELVENGSMGTIKGFDYGLSAFKTFYAKGVGTFGTAAALYLVKSEDSNADSMLVPYLAVSYTTPLAGWFFDAGFARSPYRDTTASQATATLGTSLFDWWVWSQTRVFYIGLTNPVQSMSSCLAVDEKLTLYMIPKLLSATLDLTAGNRVHAYDPDAGAIYTLPDVKKWGTGLAFAYTPSRWFKLYLDISYEAYDVTLNVTTANDSSLLSNYTLYQDPAYPNNYYYYFIPTSTSSKSSSYGVLYTTLGMKTTF